MNRHLVTALAVLAAVAVAAAPADAATKKKKKRPKPWSKTVTVTDTTPDPSGGAVATPDICNGAAIPAEKGIEFKITAPGKIKASLEGITGDWGLALRKSDGTFLTGDDVNPPDGLESLSYKAKKAGTFVIQACNLGAVPTATLKYSYTPS